MILRWKDEEIQVEGHRPIIPSEVVSALQSDVSGAFALGLESPFIVNDTEWFALEGGKLKPRVVNKAEHISRGFQEGLKRLGWKIDHSLFGQEIDGFKSFTFERIDVDVIDREAYFSIVNNLPFDGRFVETCTTLFNCFYFKPYFRCPPAFEKSLFTQKTLPFELNVGLEFETGNIASSFRALAKLDLLFRSGYVDVAIFVTSDSKRVSTRIWPSANRNGSLEELAQRRFLSGIQVPIMVCGFEPDGWSRDVGYLDKTGRYMIKTTDDVLVAVGRTQRAFLRSEDGRLLRPKTQGTIA